MLISWIELFQQNFIKSSKLSPHCAKYLGSKINQTDILPNLWDLQAKWERNKLIVQL